MLGKFTDQHDISERHCNLGERTKYQIVDNCFAQLLATTTLARIGIHRTSILVVSSVGP